MHPRTVDIRLMCFQYPCTWPRECLARRCHLEYRRVPVKPVIKPVIRSYSTWVFQRFAFRHEGQRQGQGQGEEYISRERPYSSKSVRLSVAGPLPGFCWVIWCCWWCGTPSRRRWQDSTPCKCSLCQFIAKRFEWSLREWWALFTLKNHEPNNEHWRSLALRKESQRLLWLERSWSGRGSNQAETWRELKELGPLGPLTAFSV